MDIIKQVSAKIRNNRLLAFLSDAYFRFKIQMYQRKLRRTVPEEPEPPPIHVESAFDDFVRMFGGDKISELITNTSDMPKNADYYFRSANVIAELKTMQGIFAGDEGISQLINAFRETGFSGSDVFGYFWRDEPLPEEVKALVRRRIRRGIEQRIRKARAQLRESSSQFGNLYTKKAILLAMDKPPIFGHDYMLYSIADVMGSRFWDEDTHVVVYFNPNMPTKISSNGLPMIGWYPIYCDDQINEELSPFIDLLGNQWLTFYGSNFGQSNPILKFNSPANLFTLLRRQ